MAHNLTEFVKIELSCDKCNKCLQPINELTGRNPAACGDICDDCSFEILGEEFEKHPMFQY